MALQISEARGVFSVFGKLNKGNANILKRHMTNFLNATEKVILNLERVEQIDEIAARTLESLYRNALQNNTILIILGKQNEKIVSTLEATNTAYILSPNR
ncbi:STAS domain-containing protein [uncultured Croceitalea sp.]|uniref:STAS domain-containing protein n=1 Tax=uncultured Croceitalea sp. TaxID=1798908 RepID=UPI003305E61C